MSESYVTYIGASPANIILVLGWAGGRPERWHKLSSGGVEGRIENCRRYQLDATLLLGMLE